MLKVENLLEPIVIFLSIKNGYIGTISLGIWKKTGHLYSCWISYKMDGDRGPDRDNY
jgi:hypothetical protein